LYPAGCAPATLSKAAERRCKASLSFGKIRPNVDGRYSTLECDGRTYYFVDEDTLREFEKESAAR
jgi:hypothetical protein